MINNNWGALKRIKLATLAVCLLTGFSTTAQAYKMSSGAKGKCPKGYYRVVTSPAEFRRDYDGPPVTEYRLPSNVCLKRTKYGEPNSKVNFSIEDFIVIKKNGSLKPFKNVQFRADRYEAVAGHYARSNGSYYDSADTESNDFSGMHPFLVSTTANATIRYKRGVYLINKQTLIDSEPRSVGVCPSKYSRVGNSKTCYSRANGLKLNNNENLELIDIKRASCPSGYSIGASGGICTTDEAWAYPNFYGLSKTPSLCSAAEYRDYGRCLPRLAAVSCEMDLAREKNPWGDDTLRIHHPNYYDHDSRNYKYNSKDKNTRNNGTYVMIWRTEWLHPRKFKLDLSDYLGSVKTKKVKVSTLRNLSKVFPNNEHFFRISRLDKGTIPILHLKSGLLCEDIWDSGYSLDPVPTWW